MSEEVVENLRFELAHVNIDVVKAKKVFGAIQKKLNQDHRLSDREIVTWMQGYMEANRGWLDSL